MKYVEEGDLYIHHIDRGNEGKGNDNYIVTKERNIDISSLSGMAGIRLIMDREGEQQLRAFLKSRVNRDAAALLGLSAPTVSRIRTALKIPALGHGGDRKSHRYFRKNYDDNRESEQQPAA